MSKKNVSATIEIITIQEVLKIAEKDNKRSFSAMVGILLSEAIEARKKNQNKKRQPFG